MIRKRTSRLLIAPAILAASALAFTACGAEGDGGSSTDVKPVDGGTLTIYTTADDMSFDPATSQSLAITSLGLNARRLTAWKVSSDSATEVIPDLATDTGTPSDDGKTWTFTLKDGVKFEDGTPITSEAVKFGLERSFATELSGGLTYHKAVLDGAEDYHGPFDGKHLDSIETPDDKTIVFHLNRSYGDFPWVASTPAFAPVPLDAGDPAEYAQHPVASGPYSVKEYKAGSQVVMEKNPEWDPATDEARSGGPDEIIFKLAQDPSVVAQSLIADREDSKNSFLSTFVPAAQLVQAQNDPKVGDRLVTSGPGALEYLALNNDSDQLSDPKVREAIEYAVDKTAYLTSKGGAISGDYATTLITPGIAGREEYSLYGDDPAGDIDKAKELLAEANATDLDLILAVPEAQVASAEAIQQSLAKADITVTIQSLDQAAWTALVPAGDGTGYDMTISGWQPDIPSASANIQPLFASDQIGNGNYNLSRYNNPDVDAAIEAALSMTDPDEANAAWVEIDKQIMADAPVVPLIYSRNSFIHGSGVTNFEIGEFPAYPNYLTVSLGE